MSRLAAAAAAAVIATVALLSGAQAAIASQGSIPAEVVAYTTAKDGLVAQLNDVFGVGSKGTGINFDATTTAGPISRVWRWTDGFSAGTATDHPVQRLNQWVTTISVNKHVVGFATISVNDATIEPELASFERAVALGTALLVVPGDAAVIRDDVTSAWFTLTGTSLVALSAGTSGVATSTPVVTYQERLVAAPHTPTVDSEPNQGLIVGSITLGAAIGLVIVSLLVLSRRRAAADATLDATAPDAVAPEPVAEASPATHKKPIIPAPVTAQTTAQKPTAVAPARARQGDENVVRSKPVAPKRLAQSPVAPKPVAPKPASKTTARGPRASKPAVTPEL